MYFWAVQHFGIDKITHKYLVKGHTQNQTDSMHSCIERNKKLYLKANNIYVPADWIGIIKTAKRTGSPFQVYEATGDEFLDFKKFSEHFNFKDLPFTDMKMFEVCSFNLYALVCHLIEILITMFLFTDSKK